MNTADDTKRREMSLRVRAAVTAAGYECPATIPTPFGVESHRDLATAVEICRPGSRKHSPFWFDGELSLDGKVRPCRGGIGRLLEERERHAQLGFVAHPDEAALLATVTDYAVSVETLTDAILLLDGKLHGHAKTEYVPRPDLTPTYSNVDMADLPASFEPIIPAIVAAIVADVPILLVGPPGAGKTMLARRIAGMLPGMTRSQVEHATRTYDDAGIAMEHGPVTSRPFRAPHHTVSDSGLLGGGKPRRPGEYDLARYGVLMLDEVGECRTSTLSEVARKYLGDTQRPVVVGTAEECPRACPPGKCRCTPEQIASYRKRLQAFPWGVVVRMPDLPVALGPRLRWTSEQLRTVVQDVQEAGSGTERDERPSSDWQLEDIYAETCERLGMMSEALRPDWGRFESEAFFANDAA